MNPKEQVIRLADHPPSEKVQRLIREALTKHVGRTPNGCLKWTGKVTTDQGAPIFRCQKSGKQKRVSRMVAEAVLERDLLPEEKVRQSCKQITCVEWSHLEVFSRPGYSK